MDICSMDEATAKKMRPDFLGCQRVVLRSGTSCVLRKASDRKRSDVFLWKYFMEKEKPRWQRN